MQLQQEAEILDAGIRAQIIQEIMGSENKNRKDRFYKDYQVYKDNTSYYVIQKMMNLFEAETVKEMSYAIANVSLLRKIIDKLARVYSNGVKRVVMKDDSTPNEDLTKNVEELAKELCMNTKMKKTNRAYKRDKNLMFYVKPVSVIEEGQQKYSLDLIPLNPYLYDVVENKDRREEALCVILSHYEQGNAVASPVKNEQQAAIHGSNGFVVPQLGDGKDQKIADSPADTGVGKRQFIWWSDNYHFTTDINGNIINSDGQGDLNPIGIKPFVNFASDQDGSFWAVGGDDLVDGSILVNCMITHTNHIGITQGYGQMYMTGKNLPSAVKVGPSRAIRMEYDKEDPVPSAGFMQANPPLADLRGLIEMYVAMLLTTNNLSVSGIATQLGQGQSPASGIAIILDKAESLEDVQDQEQIFHDNEPKIWKLIAKWSNYYRSKNLLSNELMEYTLPEDIDVQLKFGDAHPIMSEKEKLDNLVIRKDLGLNQMWELLMIDDPSLTEEQAKKKLADIVKERMQRMAQATAMNPQGQVNNGNQVNTSNGNPPGDVNNPPTGSDGNPTEPAQPS